MSSYKDNQPQISIDNDKKGEQNQLNKDQHNERRPNNPQNTGKGQELKKSIQMIQQIRQKHPDCIPIFYVKHEQSPKQFPSPKIPFILFKKELKIQQAMYNLYSQIEVKGLYFFCTRYDQKEKRIKYVILKPGETIQEVYKKYGKNGHLTIIYGDRNIGMGGINRAEKWLIRVLIILMAFWVFLFAQPMYYAYQDAGLAGVWQVVSLAWSRPNRQASVPTNSSTPIHQPIPSNQQQDTIQFTEKDLAQQEQNQQSPLSTIQNEEKDQILL